MTKELLVSSTSLETRLAILEDDQVTQISIERTKNRGVLGNIYKGRVTKVLPGMQAAFVDIGMERHAFLYVADFLENPEEYEEFFAPGEDQSFELVAVDAKPDTQKRRSGRGRREGTRSRRSSKAGSTDTPVTEAAAQAPPQPRKAPPVRVRRPEPAHPILPALLELSHAEALRLDAPAEQTPPPSRVLPSTLPVRIDFELPPRPAETARAEQGFRAQENNSQDTPNEHPESPASEAVLEEKPEIHEFAARTEPQRRRRGGGRNGGQLLIGDLVKEGQEILVQVAKEPIGKKGARITSHVALPGRYVVYMPTVDHVGVSRKIASDKERARLRDIVTRFRGEFGRGFIVRTAGDGHTEEDLVTDMTYLSKLWEDIRVKADKRSAPALVHQEPGLVERVIRDYFSADFKTLRVDDEQQYARIVEFVSRFNPELVHRVRLYQKAKPIFDEFGITTEIENALKHKVWLKSGGYIVINQTEALVAIDVNTGKFVGKTNSLEDTITKTNLGAVREVVRQIRLRDLGGIIVVDFIDMDDPRNRQKVMEALQNELAKDKSPSKILQFNEFGLVAITRKRVKQSLEKVLCQPCIFCSGTGMTKSTRTISYSIHQEIRRMLPHLKEGQEILIRCHPEVARALRDGEKDVIQELKEIARRSISIKPDPLMHIEEFDLVEV